MIQTSLVVILGHEGFTPEEASSRKQSVNLIPLGGAGGNAEVKGGA